MASSAYLRCPNCNSTDLKKVSLAYQEGRFYTDANTRLRAVMVGGSSPDFVIGKATTRAFHQSVLSRRLSPPVKWSYRKLIRWWAVMFLSIGWLIFYVNTITRNSSVVLSPPLTLFSALRRRAPTVAGSLLEAQSVRLQASVFAMGTLFPLPALWHYNGAGIGLAAAVAAALATEKPALGADEVCHPALQVSGIVDLPAIRERGKAIQSDIHADLLGRLRQPDTVPLDGKTHVPIQLGPAARETSMKVLPVTLLFSIPKPRLSTLDTQLAVIEQSAAITVGRKGDAVVPSERTEAREAGLRPRVGIGRIRSKMR